MEITPRYTFGLPSLLAVKTRNKAQEEKKKNSELRMRKEQDMKQNLDRIIIQDMRNPLTVIAIANQLLKDELEKEAIPAGVFELTGIISRNTSRLEAMLNDLLKIKNGEGLELITMDICQVIDDSVEKTKDRLFLKKVEVSKEYLFGFLVRCDAERLSLAFQNIIIHSLERIRNEEGKLSIEVYQANNEIKIVFKDNGRGMEPDALVRLFDDNSAGKEQAFGVGLTHVKQILDCHNATIEVNSRPGEGTSVIVGFEKL